MNEPEAGNISKKGQKQDSGEISGTPLKQIFAVSLGTAVICLVVITIAVVVVVDKNDWNDDANYFVILLLFMPIYLLLMRSLWGMAYNTQLRALGHAARAYAVLTSAAGIAAFIWAIYYWLEA